MSNRSQPVDSSTQESESHKKHKPNSLTIHHLTQDEMSIVLNFLHKGEILILATLCKQLYSTIYNLVESIIHPREFNVENWSSRSLESMLSHYSWLDVGKKTIRKEIEEMANRGGIERLAKVFYAEFEDADDVFSIPLRKEDKYSKISQQWIKLSNKYQDTRNTVEETVVDQVPVGFQVRKLCLVSNNPFKTLNYLQNIEELLLHRRHVGNVEPLSDGFRAIMLNKLRILRIDLSDCEDYMKAYISGLLQLSPNLERLESTSCLLQWDDELIVFISEMCKKLKKIKLKGNSNISDDSLYKVFKNLPHLTHFEIENNAVFTGKFLSKIGEFPQLKFFKVDRRGDDLVESCADLHLGGGILPNLEFLELGIEYDSIYENEHLFIESLKLVTPNLKCAGSMINIYEGYVCRYALKTLELFVNTLESFTLSTISALCNPIIAAKFFKLLPNVKTFKVEGVLTLDVLKELEIHSKVEKLTLETTVLSLEYLLKLSKVFPNLKILKFKENVSSSYDTQTADVLNVLKVINDGHFQHLEMISIYGMQFLGNDKHLWNAISR
ncbi:predicted protein [Naegleria gruberi]|uniref:Predicted protein n=1 Tax=Naegleria gruberi TaxID=5762 RepID=D2W2S4_NAEGR|nr:uncharacterized protein NAEGRDRAFT_54261 [Naegleria gruberi]EFC36563.1 predicted protein [Naegleria gruberi]|eukprot:XP_002669307.1 predicted protein [Naegleria gruberi strain NEG-M]